MVDDLLEKDFIQLPEPKHLKETRRRTHLKLYRYHRVISNLLRKVPYAQGAHHAAGERCKDHSRFGWNNTS